MTLPQLKQEAREAELKKHLLANFCDGDSWEDADALSLTKHGALDVAKYFYELGRIAGLEKCEGVVKESEIYIYNPDLLSALEAAKKEELLVK